MSKHNTNTNIGTARSGTDILPNLAANSYEIATEGITKVLLS